MLKQVLKGGKIFKVGLNRNIILVNVFSSNDFHRATNLLVKDLTVQEARKPCPIFIIFP
jgi:hypothetical protein